SQAKRLILFDMEATAERHASVISSVLLGAVCGSGALPFRKEAFEAAISRSGIAVNTNLAAFEDAYRSAERGDSVTADRGEAPTAAKVVPTQSRSPELQPLLDRVHRFPERLQALVLEGVRRAIDYQDPPYAVLYLERIERIAELDAKQ